MTSKEKAKEIIDKVLKTQNSSELYPTDRKTALLIVDEICNSLVSSTPKDDPYANLASLEYWQEVKREIEDYD